MCCGRYCPLNAIFLEPNEVRAAYDDEERVLLGETEALLLT